MRCLMWDTNPCSSERSSIFVMSLPIMCRCARDSTVFLVRPCFCLSYPFHCGPFIICCRDAVQLIFRFFFIGNFSICSCRFVVSVGGSDFNIFLYHHLELLPWLLSVISEYLLRAYCIWRTVLVFKDYLLQLYVNEHCGSKWVPSMCLLL